ncbi:MAG TPA: hypothetical protein VI548_05870 [Chitinophagaceae bacterium]|nr:hypothetical protein [Chitinophagaceae bacterium]
MKKTVFYIVLNLKTSKGFESFGKFYIGNNRKTANSIFKSLAGNKDVNEKDILLMELMETVDGLPLNIRAITCSLAELAENCKIITKEIFKFFNLNVIKE